MYTANQINAGVENSKNVFKADMKFIDEPMSKSKTTANKALPKQTPGKISPDVLLSDFENKTCTNVNNRKNNPKITKYHQ